MDIFEIATIVAMAGVSFAVIYGIYQAYKLLMNKDNGGKIFR